MEAVENVAVDKSPSDAQGAPSSWLRLAIQTALTVLTVVAVLAVYDRYVVRPMKQIAIVDVAEVLRLKEKQFAQAITSAGSSESDRSAVVSAAGEFARKLPAALAEVSNECNCLVLVKAAVVGDPGNAIDLTDAVKRKVGLTQ